MIDAIPTPWSATHGNRTPFPVAFMASASATKQKILSKNGFLSHKQFDSIEEVNELMAC
jgi:hypothetical protein